MAVPAVFRSTHPAVIETHRANVTRGREAATKWRRFSEDTALEPAIVYHPQGAIVTGAYPAHGTDPTTPPPGWYWDEARGLLAPSLATDEDRQRNILGRLAEMEWVVDTLPGLHHTAALHDITCLDSADDSARLEALTAVRTGGHAVLEIDGAVWLILPHELAEDVDPQQWERARRYALEDALAGSLILPQGLRA